MKIEIGLQLWEVCILSTTLTSVSLNRFVYNFSTKTGKSWVYSVQINSRSILMGGYSKQFSLVCNVFLLINKNIAVYKYMLTSQIVPAVSHSSSFQHSG